MTQAPSTPSLAQLVADARAWIDADPDPGTREQLSEAVGRGDADELDALIGHRLEFGTAGLRAPMGAGPARMNRLVVQQTAAGICDHLRSLDPALHRRIVVGHDARHRSGDFAADVVDVMTRRGFDVCRFQTAVPTPLLAFAVRQLQATAGVMITASHNPGADNGMKVFWSDGAQIVPPLDSLIEERIRAAASDWHRPAELRPEDAVRQGSVIRLGGPTSDDPVVLAYLEHCLAAGGPPPPRPTRVAWTAMHGVGADLLERALRRSGHPDLYPVRSQRAPDPDFPTVERPNPEEPGALDELLSLAALVRADVALALDPDADRLAVAVPTRGHGTGWQTLTGDETGALLAHRLLERSVGRPDRFIASTIVSSRLVGRMCGSAGVDHVETLTGFKWLARPGLSGPVRTQVLLYEEALGYAVGPDDRDKDGITASLAVIDAIAALAAEGRTVWDLFDHLALLHGAFVTDNGGVRLTGPDASRRALATVDRLVAAPPAQLGEVAVVSADRPAAVIVRWLLDDDTRVIVRPSGTEPLLKYYCEAVEPVRAGHDPHAAVERARSRAGERLARITDDVRVLLG